MMKFRRMICLSPRQVPYNPKQLLFEHGNVRENRGFSGQIASEAQLIQIKTFFSGQVVQIQAVVRN